MLWLAQQMPSRDFSVLLSLWNGTITLAMDSTRNQKIYSLQGCLRRASLVESDRLIKNIRDCDVPLPSEALSSPCVYLLLEAHFRAYGWQFHLKLFKLCEIQGGCAGDFSPLCGPSLMPNQKAVGGSLWIALISEKTNLTLLGFLPLPLHPMHTQWPQRQLPQIYCIWELCASLDGYKLSTSLTAANIIPSHGSNSESQQRAVQCLSRLREQMAG